MAEAIEKELAVDVELEPGKIHSFDVLVNDELIFSKGEQDRFPEPDEIIELIRSYLETE